MITRILVPFIICHLSSFGSAMDQYAMGDYGESPRMDAGPGADAGYDGGQGGNGRRGFGYRGRRGGYGGYGGGVGGGDAGGGVGRGYGGREGGPPGDNELAQGYGGGYRGAGRGDGGYYRGGAQDETQGVGSPMGRPYDSPPGPPQGGGFYRGGAQDETQGAGSPMGRPYDSPPGPPQGGEDYGYRNVPKPSFGNRDYGGGADVPIPPAYDSPYNPAGGRYGALPYVRGGRGRFGRNFVRTFVPDDSPVYNEKGEKVLGVYYSLRDVLDGINISSNASVWYFPQLCTVFDRQCRRFENRSLGTISEVQSKQRNIIVNIEGPNRELNRNIALMVARSMGAEVSFPPASTLSRFRPLIQRSNLEFKRAYFGLNYYAMADEIKGIIRTIPIIMSSYWIDQCVYGVIKYYDELPEANSSAYIWPKDLLKPDVLFFLNLPEAFTTRLDTNFFKVKLITAFRRLQDPKAIEINSTANAEEVTSIILKYINNLIEGKQTQKK